MVTPAIKNEKAANAQAFYCGEGRAIPQVNESAKVKKKKKHTSGLTCTEKG